MKLTILFDKDNCRHISSRREVFINNWFNCPEIMKYEILIDRNRRVQFYDQFDRDSEGN